MLESYAGDYCMLLCRCLEDGFHDIKKAACSCTAALAAAVTPAAMEPHAEKLATVRGHLCAA